jgi:hypothetical protein
MRGAIPTGMRQQHRGVAKAGANRQTEQAAGMRPANPVDDPAGIERRKTLVAAVASARCKLDRGRPVPRIEDGADAQEDLGWIVVEEARQQAGRIGEFNSSPRFCACPCQR